MAEAARAYNLTDKDDEQLLEHVRAAKAKRKASLTQRFKPYFNDPVGFNDNILLGFVWSKQRQVLESVRDNRITCVPSCHDVGKALWAGEPVLTPHGWKPIGAIAVGDHVIAGDGSITTVVGVYPQGERDLYRVTINDGSSVLADADHQWTTTSRAERRAGRDGGVRTTAEIASTLTFPNGAARGLNHQIPVCGQVQHAAALLPIEPYLFGQWLGDGSSSGELCGAPDQMEQLLVSGSTFTGRHYNSPGSDVASVSGLRKALRVVGMFGLRSYEKFIPEVFLRGSPSQRIALLQGLMDTDGTIGTNGALTFDTTAPRLADDVSELARSLGAVVRRSGRVPKFNGVEHRYCYRVYISMPSEVQPFRLPRKIARLRLASRSTGNGRRHLSRFIKSVAFERRDQAVCIAVAHESRTFVTRDHIVTHNTRVAAIAAAWWIARDEPGQAFVVTLAPTAHQVKALLWRELRKVHEVGQLPGKLNVTEWKINNELVAFGRSPADNDPTAIQGIHAARVLVVGDEATGLAKAILDAASTLVANDESRTLLIGNPDDPSVEFAELCKPGSGAVVIPISAFDSPNFTGEEVPAWLRPLLVSKTWVAERAKRWGLTSPLYMSKVLGQFPEQSTDGLVSIADLNAAKMRGAVLDRMPGNDGGDLGVDVARFGDDSSVIYHRRGDYYERLKSAQKRDTMFVTGMVIDAVRETKARRVKIDDAGIGGAVTDRLREIQSDATQTGHAVLQNVEIIPINVGESPRADLSDERFKNLRAEINWQTRERFTTGKITLIEHEPGELDDLLSEAAQIKYKLTSGGEIQIEAKADMKKRLAGSSPDDWDALVLAGAEPQFPGAGMLEYYRQLAADAEAQRGGKAAPTAAASAPAFPWGAPAKSEPGRTRLVAPTGVSTAYGMAGNRYDVVDGVVHVLPDDVQPLCSAGFKTDA